MSEVERNVLDEAKRKVGASPSISLILLSLLPSGRIRTRLSQPGPQRAARPAPLGVGVRRGG